MGTYVVKTASGEYVTRTTGGQGTSDKPMTQAEIKSSSDVQTIERQQYRSKRASEGVSVIYPTEKTMEAVRKTTGQVRQIRLTPEHQRLINEFREAREKKDAVYRVSTHVVTRGSQFVREGRTAFGTTVWYNPVTGERRARETKPEEVVERTHVRTPEGILVKEKILSKSQQIGSGGEFGGRGASGSFAGIFPDAIEQAKKNVEFVKKTQFAKNIQFLSETKTGQKVIGVASDVVIGTKYAMEDFDIGFKRAVDQPTLKLIGEGYEWFKERDIAIGKEVGELGRRQGVPFINIHEVGSKVVYGAIEYPFKKPSQAVLTYGVGAGVGAGARTFTTLFPKTTKIVAGVGKVGILGYVGVSAFEVSQAPEGERASLAGEKVAQFLIFSAGAKAGSKGVDYLGKELKSIRKTDVTGRISLYQQTIIERQTGLYRGSKLDRTILYDRSGMRMQTRYKGFDIISEQKGLLMEHRYYKAGKLVKTVIGRVPEGQKPSLVSRTHLKKEIVEITGEGLEPSKFRFDEEITLRYASAKEARGLMFRGESLKLDVKTKLFSKAIASPKIITQTSYKLSGFTKKSVLVKPTYNFQDGKVKFVKTKYEGFVKINDLETVYLSEGLKPRFYPDVIGHEKGHIVHLKLKGIDTYKLTKTIFSDKSLKAETVKLMKKGLIEKGSWFQEQYKPSERPNEFFAELYKAYDIKPTKFKKVAPKIYESFKLLDSSVFQRDISVPVYEFSERMINVVRPRFVTEKVKLPKDVLRFDKVDLPDSTNIIKTEVAQPRYSILSGKDTIGTGERVFQEYSVPLEKAKAMIKLAVKIPLIPVTGLGSTGQFKIPSSTYSVQRPSFPKNIISSEINIPSFEKMSLDVDLSPSRTIFAPITIPSMREDVVVEGAVVSRKKIETREYLKGIEESILGKKEIDLTANIQLPKTLSDIKPKQEQRKKLSLAQKQSLITVPEMVVETPTGGGGTPVPPMETPPPPEPPPDFFDFPFPKRKTIFDTSVKTSVDEIAFVPRYKPSVEAVVFDIKGVRPSKRMISTGLVLRPLKL